MIYNNSLRKKDFSSDFDIKVDLRPSNNFDGLSLTGFIYPYFVRSGINKEEKIKSFPGIKRFSIDKLIEDIKESRELGLKKFILFGIPDKKDNVGTQAYKKDNIVSLAVSEIKNKFPDLIIMTDVCLCAYTNHGHCGVLKKGKIEIGNKKTLELLSQMALRHAETGSDWVCPSAMAKKQVFAIRQILDKNGYKNIKILGYSAKFNSNFYGPFRNVADSSPKFGDRSAYQLDYKNKNKALEEIKNDILEGASMVMVKPALSYLDIMNHAKEKFKYPLAAYNTSGEYALVKYGAKLRLFDEKRTVFEIISSIKRAGADFIISYHAKDIAKWLKQN